MAPETQCVHCGDHTSFRDDPSPDLCAMCRVAGKFSPLWGPDEEERYRATLRRLEEGAMAYRAALARMESP